jgi:hypothetical protein
VCFVKLQALSLNSRFIRASIVKDLYANCTRHVSRQ